MVGCWLAWQTAGDRGVKWVFCRLDDPGSDEEGALDLARRQYLSERDV